MPVRSQSGPLSDVSNSVRRAAPRTLSTEIGLVEAPAKGGRPKQGPQPASAQQPPFLPGQIFLDIAEPAVPGMASEVALGKGLGLGTAAVSDPTVSAKNSSSAVTLQSSGTRTGRDKASGAAVSSPTESALASTANNQVYRSGAAGKHESARGQHQ